MRPMRLRAVSGRRIRLSCGGARREEGEPAHAPLVTCAALSAQCCNPIIKAFTAQLKADGQTLQSHQRVACIRKLFTLLNARLKTGTEVEPENRPNHPLRT